MKASKAALEIEELMTLHPKGFDLSLGRISDLLSRLGNPQNKLPPIIHIAGTNGKGSTTAFCRAFLEAAGLSVHVHTSPHLVTWHERFRIGKSGHLGELVDDEMLADAIRRVAKANDGQKITVFEILTAVMFLLFAENPADVAILEVGLGGRLDATNVILKPAVSVITPISIDHASYLGDTFSKIATEKAGIIKRGCPVVIGNQRNDEALETIISIAKQNNSPMQIMAQDFSAHTENGRFIYQDGNGLDDLPLPKLVGHYQLENAATAIMAIKTAGFQLSNKQLEIGLTSVKWPARMQKITAGNILNLLPENSDIWLDGGHNPEAGGVVHAELLRIGAHDKRELIMICGMINTKDATQYFEQFRTMPHKLFTVPISSSDAGIDPVELAENAALAGIDSLAVTGLAEAFLRIKQEYANKKPPRIFIGGSLYLAGEVLFKNGTPPD